MLTIIVEGKQGEGKTALIYKLSHLLEKDGDYYAQIIIDGEGELHNPSPPIDGIPIKIIEKQIE